MKALNETFKYYFKNIIFILTFAILPACFIGGLLQPFSILNFLVDYATMPIKNFGTILIGLFGMEWFDVLNWFFASIIIVVLLSAFLGNIENHFRSGKLDLSNSSSFINNNFLATCVYLFVYLIGYLFIKFILGLFIFILHIIFGRLGMMPNVALLIAVSIVSFLIFLFMIYLFSFLMIGLIDTLNSGYSFRTSLSNAGELLNKRMFKTVLIIFLPFVIILPLMVCGLLFNFSGIASIVSLIILFSYMPVSAYSCYYEYSGIVRYDNIKRYYY